MSLWLPVVEPGAWQRLRSRWWSIHTTCPSERLARPGPGRSLCLHSQKKDSCVGFVLQAWNRELAFAEHLDFVPGFLHMWLRFHTQHASRLQAATLACNLLLPEWRGGSPLTPWWVHAALSPCPLGLLLGRGAPATRCDSLCIPSSLSALPTPTPLQVEFSLFCSRCIFSAWRWAGASRSS